MPVSTIINRLLGRAYLNNPGEQFTTLTSRLLGRAYLNHNLDEITARVISSVKAKVYVNNLLDQMGIVSDRLMLRSYASTILSETEQASGYWQEWGLPVERQERKRKRFFISAFSYNRDKNS